MTQLDGLSSPKAIYSSNDLQSCTFPRFYRQPVLVSFLSPQHILDVINLETEVVYL